MDERKKPVGIKELVKGGWMTPKEAIDALMGMGVGEERRIMRWLRGRESRSTTSAPTS